MNGNANFCSTTASSNASTGALTIAGGVGVGGNLNVHGNTLITGNLVVNGQTTSVESNNTVITDNILVLNSGPSGSKDAGFVVNRFQEANDSGDGDIVNDTTFTSFVLPNQGTITPLQIKLPPSASGENDFYKNHWIRIDSGYSAQQVRKVVGYNETTKIVTVESPWTSQNPAGGDEIRMFDRNYAGIVLNEITDRFEFGTSAVNPNDSSSGLTFSKFVPIAADSMTLTSTAESTNASSGAFVSFGGLSVACTHEATSVTHGGCVTVNGGLSVAKSVYIGGPCLQIPYGTSEQRPISAQVGYIRYNTFTEQYEGFGAGDTWGSLGGVIDVNQDTKILAEEGAGTNDDNLRFFTAGTERMRINSSGNIGIGTSAPVCTVDIGGTLNVSDGMTVGNLNFTGSLYQNGEAYVSSQWSMNETSDIWYTSGNVGIGTTAPSYTLDINGNLNIDGDLYQNGALYTSSQWVQNGSNISYGKEIQVVGQHSNNTNALIATQNILNSGVPYPIAFDNGLDYGSFFQVVPTGLKFVGTQLYNVNVTFKIYITNGALGYESDYLTVAKVSGGTESNILENVGITFDTMNELSFSVSLAPNDTLKFYAAFGGQFFIGQANNVSDTGFSYVVETPQIFVGIGTTSPSSLLDINGSFVCSGGVSFKNSSNALGLGTGGSLTVLGGTSIAKDLYVGGVMTSSSDVRLKKNIRPLEDGMLEKIKSIQPVRYNYKTEPDNVEHIGFIAQDVETVFPEFVRAPNADGFRTLDYSRITSILVKCISELQKQIDDLKSKVNSP